MVSVDQAYMVGHMKNADGSINNKNVVLSAACEAAELFQCMMSVNQKLEDWQRFNHTLEMHLRSVECEKIHDICQALYGMKHPSNELEGLYLAREDEQICLLYYMYLRRNRKCRLCCIQGIREIKLLFQNWGKE